MQLRDEGAHILLGPGDFEPHAPGTGASQLSIYPWSHVLEEAERLVNTPANPESV